MKALLLILLCLAGLILAPALHDTYAWNRIEAQALAADLAEGAQS